MSLNLTDNFNNKPDPIELVSSFARAVVGPLDGRLTVTPAPVAGLEHNSP
jgi:hypothetical protein